MAAGLSLDPGRRLWAKAAMDHHIRCKHVLKFKQARPSKRSASRSVKATGFKEEKARKERRGEKKKGGRGGGKVVCAVQSLSIHIPDGSNVICA